MLSTLNCLILYHRKEKGLTQKELAKMTKISVVSIRKYEKGEILPTIENLYRLCKALNLDYPGMCEILSQQKRSRKE